MNDLHTIHSKLGNIDWKLRCLLHLLEQLEDGAEHRETEMVVAAVRHYLTTLEADLDKYLEELDLHHIRAKSSE